MFDDIFNDGELPTLSVYESAHSAVHDYMEEKRCKIDAVAGELSTTTNVLYRQLNPKDTLMPLSIDRVIAITKLTNDYRILEEVARVFNRVMIPKRTASTDINSINTLVDKANMENSDVFKVVKQAMEDGAIDKVEREKILKEIDEAEMANAQLKSTVLGIALQEDK